LVFKKLLGKISSTAKYIWANKDDEEEKLDKEEEKQDKEERPININIFC